MAENLSEIYKSDAVRAFGKALNIAVRQYDDFASLADLEYAEDPEAFSEALKRFLRRYEGRARAYERGGTKVAFRPTDENLRDLMELVDRYKVPAVRAALVSYALVRRLKEE